MALSGAMVGNSLRTPSQVEPTTEWTFHKTTDGFHPDGNEQQMMWLMNRARANPTAEGESLAGLDDPDVMQAVADLNVDLETMKAEFRDIPPKPPAAFDVRLYNAAYEHSQAMISCNCQTHDGQNTAVEDAGFEFSLLRGNVFSYADSAIHCHAALNIDWIAPGMYNDGTGMQNGRGHRVAIMSINRRLSNVGIAMVPHDGSYPDVGPLVMSGNYATAFESAYTGPPPDHSNYFIVGTVWTDVNLNGIYDPGEGLGGVTVRPDHGEYYAVSGNSGGYSIPITAAGTYIVTFSGDALPAGSVEKTVDAGDESVLLDLNTAAPLADFDATPKTGGKPLTVVFTDKSTGNIDTRQWDFGDDGVSTDRSPTHTYRAAGQYTVKLTARGPGGSDTITRLDFIKVLSADFSASIIRGPAPLTVNFTDQSSGPVTGWSWDFGDGSAVSTAENPVHTFAGAGAYTITFTVTDGNGSAAATREQYITVAPSGADINADGDINLLDLITVLQTVTAGQTISRLRTDRLPDIDENGRLGLEEAIYILEWISAGQ